MVWAPGLWELLTTGQGLETGVGTWESASSLYTGKDKISVFTALTLLKLIYISLFFGGHL